mgnify:CR=1 FL=1
MKRFLNVTITYGGRRTLYDIICEASKEDADYIVEKVSELMDEKFPEDN